MERQINAINKLRGQIVALLASLDIPVSYIENTEVTTTKEGAEEANTLIERLAETLRKLLTSQGINLDEWGKNKAKTFNHLLNEIIVGETTLEKSEESKLLRALHVATVDITYKNLKLVEERQVFEDGRVRIREMSATVNEKVLPGESPAKAAQRGMEEELGITPERQLASPQNREVIIESPSYPGLQSKYYLHDFKTILDKGQFDPRGYIEQNKQDGVTAFFGWKKAGT